MIEVDHLTKRYGPLTAIEDVTFQVEKGEILGFLGPNAAGKTTTMRCLTCFLPPTEGTARVADYDILDNPLEVRRHIGYLPESVPLYPDMTVRDYLDYMGRLKRIPKSSRQERLDYVLTVCGLQERRDEIIGKLSKGFRQRVGLAQALIHDPEVLILDEPTIGLDPRQIREVRELIKSLGREEGHTIILSTHILPEVEMTCDRVVIINEGKVVAVDTPDNLVNRIRQSATIYLEVRGQPERVRSRLQEVEGVTSVTPQPDGRGSVQVYHVETRLDTDAREGLAAAVVEGGFGLLEMRPIDLSLEDVFLRLTTEEEAEA